MQNPRDQTALYRNQPFATYPARQLLMDIYRPEGDAAVPVLLWLHGGGWHSGSKDRCEVRWLVRFGYAVAAASYRLLPRHRFPDPLHDARAAVRFLRRHAERYGLRPDAVAIGGSSSGAYLANLTAVTAGDPAFEADDAERDVPPDVQAVVNFFGFTDFPALLDLPSRRGNRADDAPEAQLLGCSPREHPQRFADISPITHVRPGLPPFLHLHGDDDPVVPLDQTRRFHDALAAAGVASKMVLVKGAGHGGPALFQNRPTRQRVVDFLNAHLHVHAMR